MRFSPDEWQPHIEEAERRSGLTWAELVQRSLVDGPTLTDEEKARRIQRRYVEGGGLWQDEIHY